MSIPPQTTMNFVQEIAVGFMNCPTIQKALRAVNTGKPYLRGLIILTNEEADLLPFPGPNDVRVFHCALDDMTAIARRQIHKHQDLYSDVTITMDILVGLRQSNVQEDPLYSLFYAAALNVIREYDIMNQRIIESTPHR